MVTPTRHLNPSLFHRWMLGIYILAALWAIRAILERDLRSLAFCAASTLFIAVLCYFWTHSSRHSRSFPRSH